MLLVRRREGKTSHWQGDRTQSTVWEITNGNPFGNRQREQSWGHGTQKPVECVGAKRRRRTTRFRTATPTDGHQSSSCYPTTAETPS
jgi:hypothetical protein